MRGGRISTRRTATTNLGILSTHTDADRRFWVREYRRAYLEFVGMSSCSGRSSDPTIPVPAPMAAALIGQISMPIRPTAWGDREKEDAVGLGAMVGLSALRRRQPKAARLTGLTAVKKTKRPAPTEADADQIKTSFVRYGGCPLSCRSNWPRS